MMGFQQEVIIIAHHHICINVEVVSSRHFTKSVRKKMTVDP